MFLSHIHVSLSLLLFLQINKTYPQVMIKKIITGVTMAISTEANTHKPYNTTVPLLEIHPREPSVYAHQRHV